MSVLFVNCVIIFVLAFCFTLYIIPLFMKVAIKKGFIDYPDGKIKTHKEAIPHLGGISIFAGFVAAVVLLCPLQKELLWLLVGLAILLLVGLVDDLNALSPLQKILGQIIAVLFLVRCGLFLKSYFFSSRLFVFISSFWILSIINAFNLIDVMDGLSSLVAIICAVALLVISLILKFYFASALLISFIGAVVAFFLYNKPPAKLYMGDAGSMFLGAFLSYISLIIPWKKSCINCFFIILAIFAIPIIEIVSLIIIRLYNNLPFYLGSPHHFSIYLIKKGFSKVGVLLFVLLFSTCFLVPALLFLFSFISFFLFIFLFILAIIAWIYTVFGMVRTF